VAEKAPDHAGYDVPDGSDFLKVVMYDNCGGPRLARYVRNVNATLFADLTPEETLAFTYRVQQYPRSARHSRAARTACCSRASTRRCAWPTSARPAARSASWEGGERVRLTGVAPTSTVAAWVVHPTPMTASRAI
jgi:hypothetical protein